MQRVVARSFPVVQRLDAPVDVLVAAGTVGSLLMALSSLWAGSVPVGWLVREPRLISFLPTNSAVAVVGFWVGLVLLVGAWLLIGHQLIEGAVVAPTRLRRAGMLWAAPFVVAMPLGSRDVWAYAAQSHIASTGANPYTVSPLDLPGLYTDNVSPRWQDDPSPYGPLWTWISRAVGALCGDHVVYTALALRLLSLTGLIMILLTLPQLARRFGRRPSIAVWLVLLNPVTVLHLVGGGHNDLLMLGFLALALYLSVSMSVRWLALFGAGALAGLATAVKFPAIIAVPFLPLIWAQTFAPGRPVRRWPELVRRLPELATGVGLAVAGAAASTAVSTVLAGYGLTWTRNLSSGGHGGGILAAALMGGVLVASWILALRWPPAPMLAVAFTAVVLITPSPLVWYWTWVGLIAGFLVSERRQVLAFAVGTMALMPQVNPSGIGTRLRTEVCIALGLILVWVFVDRAWRPFRIGAGGLAETSAPDGGVGVTPQTGS